MIPSIRTLIDQENRGGGNHDQRINIPAEEMIELMEFRKQKHLQKAREVHNSRLLEMEEAETRANLIQDELDPERPYGLLYGQAFEDIWEQILNLVDDSEDIINLRNTCEFFRDLLQTKYRTIRLIEAVLKFPVYLDGLPTLLSLRGVCKAFKLAVEQRLLLENEPPFISYVGDFTITRPPRDERHYFWTSAPKPFLRLGAYPPGHPRFIPSIAWDLEQQIFTSQAFPTLRINFWEHGFQENELPVVRVFVHRILQLIGSRVKWFYLSTWRDCLATYDQLRSWMTLMPNIEHLDVGISTFKDPPPALPLPPFPACPKLKRFLNEGLGLGFSFIAEIFKANPWITEVVLPDDQEPSYMAMLGEEEIANFREALLATTQMEWFCLSGPLSIPSQQFLEFRMQWPLKYLALTISESDEVTRDPVPSRSLISFVNSFGPTLEELHVSWKLRDNGGYLDLPKVKKLVWKLWPEFLSLEFMVALDGLQYFDVHVGGLPEIGESLEKAKAFINGTNLPAVFPALRGIRTNFDRLRMYAYGWHEVWRV